jgi:DNA-binding MarR family transcriptional regulator
MPPARKDKPLFSIDAASELETPVRTFRALLLVAQRLRYLMDDRLRSEGLTTQQAALITAVADMGRPSLNEAAAALGTTHQNAAQLVAALVRKGLLLVEDDPSDGRRRRLSTTAANTRFWKKRNRADHAAVAQWLGALSGEELQTLCTLVVRLAKALEEPVQSDA